jgi:hypothetical protein
MAFREARGRSHRGGLVCNGAALGDLIEGDVHTIQKNKVQQRQRTQQSPHWAAMA